LDDLNNPNPTVNLIADDKFYLQIFDENGCTNRDSVSVTVNPMIRANAGYDREICFGDATRLGADEPIESLFPVTFTWSAMESLDDGFSGIPLARPLTTTEYELVVRAGTCPADTDRVTVVVNPLPELITSGDVSIGPGESTLLEISGAENYYWEPFEGLSSDVVSNPAASPLVTSRYKIRGTSNKGCEAFTYLTVFVRNEIFVPELFTPNGDGQNDSFLIYGSGIKEVHLEIYTTSGQLVFKSDDLNDITVTGWNGTHNGKETRTGNYIWKLAGRFYDNQEISFKGRQTGIIKLIR
jgi:gliding motility-associated-like protein